MASNCILQHRRWRIKLINMRAHRGTSRAGVEIAGPVLLKCNTALANSCRIGDVLITPILQETHAICEFLQTGKSHSIVKDCYQKEREKKGHRTRRTSSNTVCIPLHFMLVFQVWTELLSLCPQGTPPTQLLA